MGDPKIQNGGSREKTQLIQLLQNVGSNK